MPILQALPGDGHIQPSQVRRFERLLGKAHKTVARILNQLPYPIRPEKGGIGLERKDAAWVNGCRKS
jgi:hypothetical protein